MAGSIFNVRVPLPGGQVFLWNTLTDAEAMVTADVAALLDAPPGPRTPLDADTREALATLTEHGFLTNDRDSDRLALAEHLHAVTHDRSELHISILTTLACNFGCGYCYQGDRTSQGQFAEQASHMSLDTADQVARWIEAQLDEVQPEQLVLSFLGGEPLLNSAAVRAIAAPLAAATTARGIRQVVTLVTNGLLLTEATVQDLLPLGLAGVKITLDGARDAHDRSRPMRGGQPTFDRIIDNLHRVAPYVPIAIGGNVDTADAESFIELLDFLKAQPFADRVRQVNVKPVVPRSAAVAPRLGHGAVIPLRPVSAEAPRASLTADADESATRLRAAIRDAGFATADASRVGPCHVHMAHAHTIGPDGARYACPGFTGDRALPVGHVTGETTAVTRRGHLAFQQLQPWDACGDCAFIPVCAGGCIASSYGESGDLTRPACHKRGLEAAVIERAQLAALTLPGVPA